jgi:hypothetical protein
MSRTQINLVGPGQKATLIGESIAIAPPTPGQAGGVTLLQVPEQLPILLAGPVLRTVTTSSVTIWMATSVDLVARCSIFTESDGATIAMGEGVSTQLGDKLFILLTEVRGTFPRGRLLTYNFEFLLAANSGVAGFQGDVLLNPDEIGLGGITLPSFLIPNTGGGQRILHGSCRKLHGPGADATDRIEALLRDTARDQVRPQALFLTGDQIYADDVDSGILAGASLLGRALLGWDESVPGIASRTVDRAPGTRQIVRSFGFTVNEEVSTNHLIAFGEFAAVYILAWNPEMWRWDRFRTVPAFTQVANRFAPVSIRRVLANIPTYMQFDDHELTDDVFLCGTWMRDTRNPTARQIIANGLAAFWAFQACGNPLGGRDAILRTMVSGYLRGRGADQSSFQAAMFGYHDWHYIAPTTPPVIVLDTRTQRQFPTVSATGRPVAMIDAPAGLMNATAFQQFAQQIRDTHGSPEDPLIIVSPAPYIGYEPIESLQRITTNVGAPNRPLDMGNDPESWSFNEVAFASFLRVIAESGRRRVAILSGDVHYAYTALAHWTRRHNGALTEVSCIQCTASSLKNHPGGSTGLLATEDNSFHRIGFDRDDGYSLVTPDMFRRILHLGGTPEWEFQLRWRYNRMGSTSIVFDNNFGIIDVDRTALTHSIVTPATRVSATVNWDLIESMLPPTISDARGQGS